MTGPVKSRRRNIGSGFRPSARRGPIRPANQRPHGGNYGCSRRRTDRRLPLRLAGTDLDPDQSRRDAASGLDRIEIAYLSAAALAIFKQARSPIAVISPSETFHIKDASTDSQTGSSIGTSSVLRA